MFERTAAHCCNYADKKCIGAFFKRVGGSFIHWANPEMVDKQCLITHRKHCDWFERIVIPGIWGWARATKDYALHKEAEQWQECIEQQKKEQEGIDNTGDGGGDVSGVGRYKKFCKRCGEKFRTDSPKKRYCIKCLDTNRAATFRKATKKYYQKAKMTRPQQ